MQFGEDTDLHKDMIQEAEALEKDDKWRENVIRPSLDFMAAALDDCSDKSDEE